MKSYGTSTQPESKPKAASGGDAVQHKAARDKVTKRKAGIIESEDDDMDDFSDEFDEDDLEDLEESEDDDDGEDEEDVRGKRGDDGILYDSNGAPVGIDKPMWSKSKNDKTNKVEKKAKSSSGKSGSKKTKKGHVRSDVKDVTPEWQKPLSRMSTGEWLLTLTILCIPLVNVVCIFIWSFFSDIVQEEKRNFARASLIILCIFTVILLGVGVTLGPNTLSFNSLKIGAEELIDKGKDAAQDAIKEEQQGTKENFDDLSEDDITKRQEKEKNKK